MKYGPVVVRHLHTRPTFLRNPQYVTLFDLKKDFISLLQHKGLYPHSQSLPAIRDLLFFRSETEKKERPLYWAHRVQKVNIPILFFFFQSFN
jgi:hypothetical protein